MVINFNKSNRLIELLDESCLSISPDYFKGAYSLKKSENKKLNYLYKELLIIQKSNLSSDEKYKQKIESFTKAYNCNGDFKKGERFLKSIFNEDKIIEILTKAYWQISPIRITRNKNASVDGLNEFIEKYFGKEPCKDIIIETILRQEPTEIDIEKEFWNNCTSVNEINEYCNIYREQFGENLKKVNETFYDIDTVLFDNKSVLFQYFKELRNCGLLNSSESFVEVRLMQIAKAVNRMSDSIVKLFKKLRASTKQSVIPIEKTGSNEMFLNTICRGVEILQQSEMRQECSRNIVKNINLEAPFQVFFHSLLKINYQSADLEVEKGPRKIDLKIEDSKKLPHRMIMEFKGWWNNDKNEVIKQCLGYLTDFEESAVIIMINNLKSGIEKKYKEKIILTNKTYVSNSLTEKKYKSTMFNYFKSEHTVNEKTKTIYHFIISPKIYCNLKKD